MVLLTIMFCVDVVSCSNETEQIEEVLPAIVDWEAETYYNLSKEEESIYFSFETNYDWEVNIEYLNAETDWCRLSTTQGYAGTGSIGVHVSENETYTGRTAIVTLVCKNENRSFRILQDPSPKPAVITIDAAGRLQEKLSRINPKIEHLTIEGDMNGDDIQALRDFYSVEYAMETLDLSNVNIVKGGSFEYKKDLGMLGSEWRIQKCDQDNVIPNNMFNNGFRGLEVLILPKSATAIGSYALEECRGLLQLELPTNVTTIGSSAFCNCTHVKAIDLPKTVVSIGNGAFWQCNQLVSIDIPEGVTKIESSTFAQCRNLKTINLPESLTEIAPMAFSECSYSLTKLTIPKNVKKIGYQAFYKCSKLESIVCMATTAPEIRNVLSDGTVMYPFDEGVWIGLTVPKFCASSYMMSDWRIFCYINELNN